MLTDRDKEAISHIASVSDHTHAALMAEWLITGYDVEYLEDDGHWYLCNASCPAWHKENKYRLVNPKTAKPAKRAYRVYSDRDGDLFVADRSPEGAIYQTFTENTQWLSDWVEYDKP